MVFPIIQSFLGQKLTQKPKFWVLSLCRYTDKVYFLWKCVEFDGTNCYNKV